MKEEETQNVGPKHKKGGMRTMPFIMANEACEKLAVVGSSANLLSYLTAQLHMPLTKAATTLTNFGGTSSLTPLLGAFIADAFAGRFWTITVASIIYQFGMVCLTLSATLPGLRPPPCPPTSHECRPAAATEGQLAMLYGSLLLTALGSGGIRPCVAAFGAEQFEETGQKQSTKMWNFFNWYYFCMGASILVAVTLIVYIQDNVGWGWGFGVPTALMALSVLCFVVGFPLYRHMNPAGSPLTRLAQVIVAAVRKRDVVVPEDPGLLYENDLLDAGISATGRLLHTNQFTFLDHAAVVTPSDTTDSSGGPPSKPSLWRLSTVHRIEELKSLIRMVPIWAAGIPLILAAAQQYTFSLQQARSMDRRLSSSFSIPASSMGVFTIVSMLLTVSLYDRLLIPVARRFTGLDRGISFLHRMGIGFAISVVATFVAGFVEVKRRHRALMGDGVESVFWLVPQYILHGVAEGFMSIGHLEFFYDQAPESMRSTATALFWTAISAGNYCSTLLVIVLHRFTNWLPDDDLNKGRLERLYWLITGIQVLNLGYYTLCARSYTFKPLELSGEEGDEKVKGGEVEMLVSVWPLKFAGEELNESSSI
ncbi:hypothetical protein AMTRI_Chr04g187020 [Amborella trichopoda]